MSELFYLYDEDTGDCRVVASPAILAVLLNEGFTLIKLEKYNEIKNNQRNVIKSLFAQKTKAYINLFFQDHRKTYSKLFFKELFKRIFVFQWF